MIINNKKLSKIKSPKFYTTLLCILALFNNTAWKILIFIITIHLILLSKIKSPEFFKLLCILALFNNAVIWMIPILIIIINIITIIEILWMWIKVLIFWPFWGIILNWTWRCGNCSQNLTILRKWNIYCPKLVQAF